MHGPAGTGGDEDPRDEGAADACQWTTGCWQLEKWWEFIRKIDRSLTLVRRQCVKVESVGGRRIEDRDSWWCEWCFNGDSWGGNGRGELDEFWHFELFRSSLDTRLLKIKNQKYYVSIRPTLGSFVLLSTTTSSFGSSNTSSSSSSVSMAIRRSLGYFLSLATLKNRFKYLKPQFKFTFLFSRSGWTLSSQKKLDSAQVCSLLACNEWQRYCSSYKVFWNMVFV